MKINNWKFPMKIGNLIYSFYCNYVYDAIKESDLNIFYSPTTEFLSQLILNRKFYPIKKFFYEINTEKIEIFDCTINLIDDAADWLESTQIILDRIEKLKIVKICLLFDNSTEILNNNSNKISLIFNKIGEKFGKFLQELRIHFSSSKLLERKSNFGVENLIQNCKNLKIFEFDGMFHFDRKIFKDLNGLIHSKDSLEELYLSISFVSGERETANLFQIFTNLRILSINSVDSCDGKIVKEILCNLTKSKIEELEIFVEDHEECFSQEIQLTLKNFPSIKNLHFSRFKNLYYLSDNHLDDDQSDESNNEKLKILKLTSVEFEYLERIVELFKNSNKLSRLEINYIRYIDEFTNNLINDLAKLSKNTKITLDIPIDNKEDCKNIEKMLNQCRDVELYLVFHLGAFYTGDGLECLMRGIESTISCKIKQLNFNDFPLQTMNYNLGNVFKSQCNLEVIDLSLSWIDEIFDEICSALSNSAETLKELNFTSCNLGVEHGVSLENLLKNCKNLECFTMRKNKIIPEDNILNGLKVSQTKLKDLEITFSYENFDKIVNFSKNFRQIRRFFIDFRYKQLTEQDLERLSRIFFSFRFYVSNLCYCWEN